MIRRCIRKINFEITNKYRNSFQYFFLLLSRYFDELSRDNKDLVREIRKRKGYNCRFLKKEEGPWIPSQVYTDSSVQEYNSTEEL